MTTVATDGRSMAADTHVGGECKHGTISKLRRAKDGSVLGCSGHATDIAVFLDWYEKVSLMDRVGDFVWGETLAPKPERLSNDFTGLVLRPNGTILCVEYDGTYFEHTVPAAIGSGCRFAYGAMDAGYDAAPAVRIACGRDAFSSEPVEMMWRVGLPDVRR